MVNQKLDKQTKETTQQGHLSSEDILRIFLRKVYSLLTREL